MKAETRQRILRLLAQDFKLADSKAVSAREQLLNVFISDSHVRADLEQKLLEADAARDALDDFMLPTWQIK